jgi:hypothetical protein
LPEDSQNRSNNLICASREDAKHFVFSTTTGDDRAPKPAPTSKFKFKRSECIFIWGLPELAWIIHEGLQKEGSKKPET